MNVSTIIDYSSTLATITSLVTTTPKPCSINYLTGIKTAMYVPLGGGAALTNAILVISIIRKSSLRSKKEYQLTMALSFADFVEGFATFIGGIYRLPYTYSTTSCNVYRTTLFCMCLPHTFMWRWSDTATGWMLAALAIDRYMTIHHTIWYLTRGENITKASISLVYGTSLIFFAIAWIKPLQMFFDGKMVPIVCGTSGFIDLTLVQITKYVGAVGSALSVVISTYVALRIREFIRKVETHSTYSRRERSKARKELTFTVTSLIKGLCTLILDSFPRSFGVYSMIREQIDGYNPESGGVGSFFFILTKVNAMLNVFIYGTRQPEVKRAVTELFCCQTLSKTESVARFNSENSPSNVN